MTCLGLDFDNTIVDYEALFARAAGMLGCARRDENRLALRARLRSQTDGEELWQKIQAIVYGVLMPEATPTAGFPEFFAALQERAISTYIISHKTRYPAQPPQVDLHEISRCWLEKHRFLTRERWFFEPTRMEKLCRIASLGCTHFVDDLAEVLLDPSFPPHVTRLLYAPSGARREDLVVIRAWDQVLARL